MTKQEILNAFLQAEKDWSEPIERASENHTEFGLCSYFYYEQSYDGVTKEHIRDSELPVLWLKYGKCEDNSFYHFSGLGCEPNGRTERLEAIRKVINDLKNEINELH